MLKLAGELDKAARNLIPELLEKDIESESQKSSS